MQEPFTVDIVKIKQQFKLLIVALMLSFFNTFASSIFSGAVHGLIGIVIIVICFKTYCTISNSKIAAVGFGIFSALSIVGMFVIMYLLIKCNRIIKENTILN